MWPKNIRIFCRLSIYDWQIIFCKEVLELLRGSRRLILNFNFNDLLEAPAPVPKLLLLLGFYYIKISVLHTQLWLLLLVVLLSFVRVINWHVIFTNPIVIIYVISRGMYRETVSLVKQYYSMPDVYSSQGLPGSLQIYISLKYDGPSAHVLIRHTMYPNSSK